MTSFPPRVFLVVPLTLLLSACASRSQPVPVSEPPTIAAPVPVAAPQAAEEDEDEVTGKSLYARHCAGCHNDNGDGRGATMLQQGKEARSFAQGGFAFGNTPEAIFKTITSGIPGSSLMQPFKGVMDDDERMLVANYVLTLTPYKAEKKAADSVMVVGDRAVIARGKLPSIHEGLPERPRGLMVGLPGGLSFEYRIDDVRLLAVRRGAFVDRTDWNERGGGVMKPLGDIVEQFWNGDPGAWIFARVNGADVPVELKLVSTLTEVDGPVRLELVPSLGDQGVVRSLLVSLQSEKIREFEGFERTVSLSYPNFDQPGEVSICLSSWPMETEFVLGGPPQSEGDEVRLASEWVVVRNGTGVLAHRFFHHESLRWRVLDGRRAVVLRVNRRQEPQLLGASVLTLPMDNWSEQLLEQLKARGNR